MQTAEIMTTSLPAQVQPEFGQYALCREHSVANQLLVLRVARTVTQCLRTIARSH